MGNFSLIEHIIEGRLRFPDCEGFKVETMVMFKRSEDHNNKKVIWEYYHILKSWAKGEIIGIIYWSTKNMIQVLEV